MTEQKTRKAFRSATKLIVRAAQAEERKYILLEDLRRTLGAHTAVEQNGVLWGIQDLKDEGVIEGVNRGVYEVLDGEY